MGLKGISWTIVFLAFVYFGVGIYIAYFTSHMADVSNAEIVLQAPIHLWHIVKDWVVNL